MRAVPATRGVACPNLGFGVDKFHLRAWLVPASVPFVTFLQCVFKVRICGRRAPGDRPREGRARIVVDFDILDDVARLLETTVGVERVAAKFRPTHNTP